MVNTYPRIGEEREQFAYVWNDFLKGGVRLALSSDFATSPFSPLVQLYDAVFRESPSGLYDGPWYPDQRISFDEALYAYTQIGADLSGWGDEIGSITEGKWADFAILDQRLNDPVGKELKKYIGFQYILCWQRGLHKELKLLFPFAKRFIAGTDINDSSVVFQKHLDSEYAVIANLVGRMPNQ